MGKLVIIGLLAIVVSIIYGAYGEQINYVVLQLYKTASNISCYMNNAPQVGRFIFFFITAVIIKGFLYFLDK